MSNVPHGAGKSSFDLIDAEPLLDDLEPLARRSLLDLGCGDGSYSLALSERAGPQGVVHAVDAWEEGIQELQQRMAEESTEIDAPIRTHIADASQGLPLSDNSVDLCLMATVLHDIIQGGGQDKTLSEVFRVLKPEGTLGVVEFDKVEDTPGPPLHIRLSQEELREVLQARGFAVMAIVPHAPPLYLAICRPVRVK